MRSILGVLVVAASIPAGMFAQKTAAKAPGATPDLSGVWTRKNVPGARYGGYAFMEAEPPMTAWAQEKFKTTKPSFGPRSFADSNDPVNPTALNSLGCFPPGVPRIYLHPFPMEIIQTPGRVLIMYEFDHFVRQIWTDGREHVKDLPGTWMGDSIGKWEGDTLVVDTTNYPDTITFNAINCCRGAGANLHVIERFKRLDADTIDYQYTVDDPTTFTKSWTVAIPMSKTDEPIYEYACHEGNYGMKNLLSGARAMEKAAAEAKK
jgi:hypothetical protein